MSAALVLTLHAGVVLPERLLHSPGFEILATFVALNTLMYATLAVLKLVPRGHAVVRWLSRLRRPVGTSRVRPTSAPSPRRGTRPRGRDRRAEDRSIYAGLPVGAVITPDWVEPPATPADPQVVPGAASPRVDC